MPCADASGGREAAGIESSACDDLAMGVSPALSLMPESIPKLPRSKLTWHHQICPVGDKILSGTR